jgi:16S rRNA processing protein RimM
MLDTNRLVTVGKFGAPYGVRGWIKLHSYTDPVGSIIDYVPWLINVKDAWLPVELENSRLHGKGVIVKLKGCDDRDKACYYTNAHIAVKHAQLPALKQDEYYWDDLVGLTVVNLNGVTLGKVAYLHATGANDVLVVKGSKEHWIPYLPKRVVKTVDIVNQTMTVDWDEDF